MSRYWVVVMGPDIYAKTRELGFSRHGFKSTRRNMAARVAPGDLLAFYITGKKQFAAVLRVTAPMTEEDTRVWQSAKKPGELYPFRVGIEPVVVLDEEAWLDAEPYHERFEWTRKWPRANWTLAYQGNLHEVPEADLELLLADMRERQAAVAAG